MLSTQSAARVSCFLAILVGSVAGPEAVMGQVTTIILVRHAEQVAGESRDPELSYAGRTRAQALLHVLEGVPIQAVHSTPLRRTMETAQPIAEHFGLDVITTEPTATFASDMAAILREKHEGQTVLVVSHSNTVPEIINALGGGPLEQLEHSEFDSLFLVFLTPGEPTHVLRLQYGMPTW